MIDKDPIKRPEVQNNVHMWITIDLGILIYLKIDFI